MRYFELHVKESWPVNQAMHTEFGADLESKEFPGLPGQSAQFYDAYLRALVTWAKQLSQPGPAVSPLQVEQFLFRKNGAVPLTPR